LVPARIDRADHGDALRVGLLAAAQEDPVGRPCTEAGVDAGRVRVPDLDGGALDRSARGCVDDAEAEGQCDARLAVRDVAAQLLAGDVVRAFGLLRREDAGDRARGDARRAAFRARGLPGACAEHSGHEAAELDEGAAARNPFVHAPESTRTASGSPEKELGT